MDFLGDKFTRETLCRKPPPPGLRGAQGTMPAYFPRMRPRRPQFARLHRSELIEQHTDWLRFRESTRKEQLWKILVGEHSCNGLAYPPQG